MITTPTPAPVMDAGALDRLGDQLGDLDILSGFVRSYVSMLERRIERLHAALAAREPDDWADAVLSLKTSSAMVGAVALSHLASKLEVDAPPAAVAAEDHPVRERILAQMHRMRTLAAETTRQLAQFLDPAAS